MGLRPSIYYPEAKVTTGLFTNGKEWMLEDGTEYVGFYHKYTDNTVLTEAVFSKSKSKKLIAYVPKSSQPTFIYNKLKNIKPSEAKFPISFYSIPTLDHYSKGFFERYFIYRRNYTDLFKDLYEVNKDQYDSWKTPETGINEILYGAFIINWKLTGPLNDVRDQLQIKEFGVYDTNKRLAQYYDREFPGTSKVLTDYLEFSIYSPITSYEIKKQFGIV